MLHMKESLICSCLLSDDMSLSKTITVLILIVAATDTITVQASDNRVVIYKLTLILFSSAAQGVWKSEAATYFLQLQVAYFMSSKKTEALSEQKSVIEGRVKNLQQYLSEMNSHHLFTEKTVILSIYQIWLNCTLIVELFSHQLFTKNWVCACVKNFNDDADKKKSELNENALKTLSLKLLQDMFTYIICDEAHKIKSVQTCTHQSVVLAKSDHYILLSVIFMMNCVTDLCRLLSVIWKPEFVKTVLREAEHSENERFSDNKKSEGSAAAEITVTESEYQRVNTAINKMTSAEKMTAVNLLDLLTVLNPAHFCHFITGTNHSSAMSNMILLSILKLCMLRHTMADTVEITEQAQQISKKISLYCIVTIELLMNMQQQTNYDKIYKKLVLYLSVRKDAEEQISCINIKIHCRLSHLSVRTWMERFSECVKTASKHVKKWYSKYDDHSIIFCHSIICTDPFTPAYHDCVSMLFFLTADLLKLQLLLSIIYNVCLIEKRKLLIFIIWSLILFKVEMTLVNVSFNVSTIHAAHSAIEQNWTVIRFNDLHHLLQILVISLIIIATFINLQHVCSDVIFLKVLNNVNTLLQTVGWVFRIGQMQPQNIWVLVLNCSYDQILQQWAADKMLRQIAETAEMIVTPAQITQWQGHCLCNSDPSFNSDDSDNSDDENENLSAFLNKFVQKEIICEQAAEMYCQMFRQQTECQNWDSCVLSEKDQLLGEKTYWAAARGKTFKQMKWMISAAAADISSFSVDCSQLHTRLTAVNFISDWLQSTHSHFTIIHTLTHLLLSVKHTDSILTAAVTTELASDTAAAITESASDTAAAITESASDTAAAEQVEGEEFFSLMSESAPFNQSFYSSWVCHDAWSQRYSW